MVFLMLIGLVKLKFVKYFDSLIMFLSLKFFLWNRWVLFFKLKFILSWVGFVKNGVRKFKMGGFI